MSILDPLECGVASTPSSTASVTPAPRPGDPDYLEFLNEEAAALGLTGEVFEDAGSFYYSEELEPVSPFARAVAALTAGSNRPFIPRSDYDRDPSEAEVARYNERYGRDI